MEWFSASDDWLSRWVFERGLAITYVVAFAVVLNQFRPLLGEHGLHAGAAVRRRRCRSGAARACSTGATRTGWSAAVGWVGIAVATALLLEVPQRAAAPLAMASWALLWVLYLSVVNVGQRFYSFGWESLLLEVGFLACFLGGSSTAPPVIVHVPAALAAVPPRARRRAHQAPRRPVLAGPHLPPAPPRDAADARAR